jgi:hypothetical protein
MRKAGMMNPITTRKTFMAYPPEFLKLVDQFIHLANRLAEEGKDGEVSAAILFAAGRYNAFNFLSHDGTPQDQAKAVEFYVSEYRKALVSNLEGVVGPVVKAQG